MPLDYWQAYHEDATWRTIVEQIVTKKLTPTETNVINQFNLYWLTRLPTSATDNSISEWNETTAGEKLSLFTQSYREFTAGEAYMPNLPVQIASNFVPAVVGANATANRTAFFQQYVKNLMPIWDRTQAPGTPDYTPPIEQNVPTPTPTPTPNPQGGSTLPTNNLTDATITPVINKVPSESSSVLPLLGVAAVGLILLARK